MRENGTPVASTNATTRQPLETYGAMIPASGTAATIECPEGKLRPSAGMCRRIAVRLCPCRPRPLDDLLQDRLLDQELERIDEQRRDHEPPLAKDRGDRRDDERHDRDAQVLHHDHRRLERVRQLVDGAEHRALGRRNRAVAGDDDAHDDHYE